MPLKDYAVKEFKLKADSIFDLGELYKILFKWFELNGYSFYEKEYQDIDEPNGKHIEIFWYTEKTVDSYVKFAIEINYLAIGLQKIEFEKGGVKIKTDKGSVGFNISAYLIKDYDDKWSKGIFGKRMRFIYDRIIARKRLGKLSEELANDTQQLIDEISSFCDIHKF